MDGESNSTFIFLDPRTLRPLPQSLWGHSCAWCDKAQSVWELFEAEKERARRKGKPLCSLCWLYESTWGREYRESLNELIRAVEAATDDTFQKTGDGRLWACRDADRLLGSIAVTSRIAAQRTRLQEIGASDES